MNSLSPIPAIENEGILKPGRLWSLWDMLRHDAAAFYFSTASLAMTRAGLQAFRQQDDTQPVARNSITPIRRGLETVKANLPTGCDLVGMSIDNLIEKIDVGPVAVGRLDAHLMEIEGRLRDNLKLVFQLSLTPTEAALFEPKTPLFGERVAQQFSGVAYEVEEAGKCLALGRSTAGAFHSIRCLEAGIRALSRSLGIPDPTKSHERSWMKLLGTMKTAVDAKWPTNSDRMSGDGQFFDQAHAALAAMQNPYRNSTMHLDEKYTEEEALHIFEMVKGFMKKIASRMDEDGKPFV